MSSTNTFAPGNVVVVRDEDWLITSVDESSDGPVLNAQGLSDLVRGQDAVFYPSLDRIRLNDPRDTTVRADDSPKYRRSRLWVESTLRKTAVPLSDDSLTVSPRMLARQLGYQHKAVAKALDPATLRPRILLADAVGLGKTLEIGMILSELIRRGRGERTLVVTPRHVLEQMQHEMWSRFAIPFVRLDSQGVARVKQKLPADRNPFSCFRRVIVSIGKLKQASARLLGTLNRGREVAPTPPELVRDGDLSDPLDSLGAPTITRGRVGMTVQIRTHIWEPSWC